MTYHVFCPISHKRFDFESVTHARRFVIGMMTKYNCNKVITIRYGDTMIGRMKKVGKIIVWKSVRKKNARNTSCHRKLGRIVNLDGTLGDYIDVDMRRNTK